NTHWFSVLLIQGVRSLAERIQYVTQSGLVLGDVGRDACQLLSGGTAAVLVTLNGVFLQRISHYNEQSGIVGMGRAGIGQRELALGPACLFVNPAAVEAIGQYSGGGLRPGVGHRQGGGGGIAFRKDKVGKRIDRHRSVQGGSLLV